MLFETAVSFLISGVVAYYICKWLDRDSGGD